MNNGPQQQTTQPNEERKGIKKWIWENLMKPYWGIIAFVFFGCLIHPLFDICKYKVKNIKLKPNPTYFYGDCDNKEDIRISSILYGSGMNANLKYFYANQNDGEPISDTFDITLNSDTVRLKDYDYNISSDSKIHIGYIIIHQNMFTNIFSKLNYKFDNDGVSYSKEKYTYECLDVADSEIFVRGGISSNGDSVKDFIVLQNEVSYLEYEKYAKSRGLIVSQPTEYSCPTSEQSKGVYPITNITWTDAQSYCKSLGGSLPTIKQFKYMLQGGLKNHEKDALIPFKEGIIPFYDSKKNAIGIININGNAVEWCFDSSQKYKDKKAIMGGMSYDFTENTQIQYLEKDFSLPKVSFRYVKSISSKK